MKNYLFDTNLVVALVRSQVFETNFEKDYSFAANRMTISVVVEGELESLAIQWNWGFGKIQRLHAILQNFVISPIKMQSIINAYARIDAYSQGKLPGNPLPSGMSSRNMGKNDLWIAATAHATNATLLTTDQDFNHLDGVFSQLG